MLQKAQALADELIRLRRDIHQHPELAFKEVRTAALVADTLREIGGITVRTGVGKTGVVGDLGHRVTLDAKKGSHPDPRVRLVEIAAEDAAAPAAPAPASCRTPPAA